MEVWINGEEFNYNITTHTIAQIYGVGGKLRLDEIIDKIELVFDADTTGFARVRTAILSGVGVALQLHQFSAALSIFSSLVSGGSITAGDYTTLQGILPDTDYDFSL